MFSVYIAKYGPLYQSIAEYGPLYQSIAEYGPHELEMLDKSWYVMDCMSFKIIAQRKNPSLGMLYSTTRRYKSISIMFNLAYQRKKEYKKTINFLKGSTKIY